MASTQALDQPFSDYEKVYLQMSRAFNFMGKEHWGVHCVCSIASDNQDAPVAQSTVRDAWKSLAVNFPGLVVQPVEFTKRFGGLDATILEEWANETFNSSLGSTSDWIIEKATPSDLPSLYFLPDSSEIVFLSQHWRTDALGCCVIVDRLIEHIAAKRTPSGLLGETKPILSPSLESAAGASLDADDEIRTYAFETIQAFHAKAVNSGGLPYQGDHKQLPADTQHRELICSFQQTEAIVQACRKHNISVSAAVHTALARAYFSFTEEEEQKKKGYTTVMAVNARPHLPEPYNERSHACGTYVASITPTVPYNAHFVSAARDLTNEYKTWCSDKLLKSLCWAYKYHLDSLIKPRPSPAAGAPPPKPPSGITLSSLGVVEKFFRAQHGSVSVEKFRFGVSMMTRQTLLYVWTFRGQLTLSIDYNEAYYSETMMQEVLKRVSDELFAGLELAL